MIPSVFLYGLGPGVTRLVALIDGDEVYASPAPGTNILEKAASILGGTARHAGIHAYKNERPFVDLFHERSLSAWFVQSAIFTGCVALHQCGTLDGLDFFYIGTNGLILPAGMSAARAA